MPFHVTIAIDDSSHINWETTVKCIPTNQKVYIIPKSLQGVVNNQILLQNIYQSTFQPSMSQKLKKKNEKRCSQTVQVSWWS